MGQEEAQLLEEGLVREEEAGPPGGVREADRSFGELREEEAELGEEEAEAVSSYMGPCCTLDTYLCLEDFD